jgi:ketosteroid isomerase-like protein
MASLAYNALSLSSKPVALLPACYKSQNYAFAVQRLHFSSNARFQLIAVPREHGVLSPKGRGFKTLRCTSASKGGDAEIESSAEQQRTEVVSAMPLVMDFYAAINKRDPKALSDILSDKCLFHDSAFPNGFEGKVAVLGYIKDLMDALGKEMQFKIDGISEGDDLTVAVLWHLEWDGRKFPFSKGCGIFNCEKEGERLLIRMMHHFMETPLKPGELILKLLKTITSLFEQFPLVAKKFLENPYYAFAGIIMFYTRYLKPIIHPIIHPFVIYYRGVLNTFLYWANCLLRIVLKILQFLSRSK